MSWLLWGVVGWGVMDGVLCARMDDVLWLPASRTLRGVVCWGVDGFVLGGGRDDGTHEMLVV